MFLSKIEPSEQDDHDERTFECSTCAYTETVIVQFR
jgi:hypothetical protein